MSTTLPTWHHGLVDEWWAEFNLDGREIDYFARFVEKAQAATFSRTEMTAMHRAVIPPSVPCVCAW